MDTHLPRLVAMAGYPSAGKSVVSQYLERELGFVRVSSDDIRERLLGVTDYSAFEKSPDFRQREWDALTFLYMEKMAELGRGNDVVVDTSAKNENMRSFVFSTSFNPYDPLDPRFGSLAAEKSLVVLRADPDILRARNRSRGRTNDPVAEWAKVWEEPRPGIGYDVVECVSNTSQDLERILADVDRRFRRTPGGVYAPRYLAPAVIAQST